MTKSNTDDTNINIKNSITEIQNLIRQAIDDNILPGAVLHVSHKGHSVFQKAFGMANRETGRPQCMDDLFYLGSTSKPLAVTSILTLVNEGKIGLNESASTWVPELSHCKLKQGKISRSPTLKELLSHTSGVFGNATATLRQQRLVWNFGSSLAHTATQIAKQPYNYHPGKGFSYGGASMTIASRIAEIVTGLEFDEFANMVVFRKLGMKNTFYRTDKKFKERFSILYKKSSGELHKAQFQPYATPDSFVLPAGGIITTAQDLSVFLQLHLNNTGQTGKILPTDLTIDMRTDNTNKQPMDFRLATRQPSTAGIANNEGYGLGWMLDDIDKNRRANVFFHGGAFGTIIWGDTKAELGIILLTHIPLSEVALLWDNVIRIIRNTWCKPSK